MENAPIPNKKNVPETVQLKVTPKAKHERIVIDADEDGRLLLRVYVTVAAEDGKANNAVIALLAKHYNIPKSALTITHGHTSRHKLVRISH